MPTVQELATWIVESFDSTQTTTIERICEDVLRGRGWNPYAAATEASDKAKRVLSLLRSKNLDDLPFEFSERDPNRLVGKQRIRKGDSPETMTARHGLAIVPDMLTALYEAGDCTFEKVCASLMLLSGASEAFAGCTSDDGGIDVYGRIPLRLGDEHVKSGILQTAILRKPFFFVAQCKCYQPDTAIGRPDIDQFHGAVIACLQQYNGNSKPPSHRVPESYYRREETCISVFLTTGVFTDKAESAAESFDIILVNGKQIARFLIHHQVAIITTANGNLKVDGKLLDAWASALIS